MSINVQFDELLKKKFDISLSTLRDALKGTDARDLTHLFDSLKGKQLREYYVDEFDIDDTWLWNLRREGTVANGQLTLSSGEERTSNRFIVDRGSLLCATMKWGILAQTGARRFFGWGHPSGEFFIGFYMYDDIIYAVVKLHGEMKYIDITTRVPSDYDTTYYNYAIIIDKGSVKFYVAYYGLVAEINLFQLSPHYATPQGFSLVNNDTITGDMLFDRIFIAYFTPRETFVKIAQVIYTYGGSIAGGTPLTTAWLYDVPEGERAILEVAEVVCDTDSVDGVYGVIKIRKETSVVHVCKAGMQEGVALGLRDINPVKIELLPGMEIIAEYENADTVSHIIRVRALITILA